MFISTHQAPNLLNNDIKDIETEIILILSLEFLKLKKKWLQFI